LERRLSPVFHLPEVKSIIVIGVPYTPVSDEVSPILAAPGDQFAGLISTMALSRDYHKTVRELLTELAGRINPARYKILVDSSALVEREWAVKAGVGFWGKNCCVISPSKGSFFYIGLLLTDLEISVKTDTVPQKCGTCTQCIDACPGKALTPYHVDYKKCISYITQKCGALSAEDEIIMGSHVYGCEICQRVCPYNKEAACGYPPVNLNRLINMTEDEFAAACGNTVMGWKGLKILKRNAQAVFKTVYNRG